MKIVYFFLILSFFACSSENESPEKTILVAAITIEGTSEITTSGSTPLAVTVSPSNATNKKLNWTSSNESIAIVSAEGIVTPKKNGEVTITAAATDNSNVKYSKNIKINGAFYDYEVRTVSELQDAFLAIKEGQTMGIHGGTYVMTKKLVLNNSGSLGKTIQVIAIPSATRPMLDFSFMTENSSNQGILLNGNYWHIKGLDIIKAGDNGMQIKGSYNQIEFCSFSECKDTGLQLDSGAAYNKIINCDSFFNADSTLENADGFACKMNAGTRNEFIGCRAWQNLDDGWDGYLRGADNIETSYSNCWAISNGYLKDGTKGKGDGNGFKTGGSDFKDLKHQANYAFCIAVNNVADGFDHNSNRGTVTITNCSAYNNGKNYSFSATNPLEKLILKNSCSLGGSNSLSALVTDISHNGWQNNLVTSEADFVALNYKELLAKRKPDGSLPEVTFMHLVSSSDLIDKGINRGWPFMGSAPDIGAFEYKN
ncbi:right-handed parallel beta-helix repeat-containing protein [Flavobacterium sp. RSSA_27]|uniref:right-handed parallel beta-helix repeat-containing protein n=1 Tax=Flavobacterium sp. RSSA_27 TaxID=3447667 RepID=UPI003F40CBFE